MKKVIVIITGLMLIGTIAYPQINFDLRYLLRKMSETDDSLSVHRDSLEVFSDSIIVFSDSIMDISEYTNTNRDNISLLDGSVTALNTATSDTLDELYFDIANSDIKISRESADVLRVHDDLLVLGGDSDGVVQFGSNAGPYLYRSSSTILTSDAFTVGGNLSVGDNDILAVSSLDVGSNIYDAGDGEVVVNDNLDVQGNIELSGNITDDTDAIVNIGEDLSVAGAITATDVANLQGTIYTTASSQLTFGDDFDMGDYDIANLTHLDLGGNIYDAGDGEVIVNDNLDVNGDIAFSGTIYDDTDNYITMGESMEIAGNIYLNGGHNLHIQGGNIFDNGDNTVNIGENLDVDGSTTVNGNLDMNDNNIVDTGDISVSHSQGSALINNQASSTTPTILPQRDDTNTGIGGYTGSGYDYIYFIAGGNTIMSVSAAAVQSNQKIVTSNASGPAMLNEAASSTNPTLIPHRGDLNTGIGWLSGDNLNMVAGGSSIATFNSSYLLLNTTSGIQFTNGSQDYDVKTINNDGLAVVAETGVSKFYVGDESWYDAGTTLETDDDVEFNANVTVDGDMTAKTEIDAQKGVTFDTGSIDEISMGVEVIESSGESINHGFDGTPDVVLLTPTSNNTVWVTNIDGTSFDVNHGSGSPVTVHWLAIEKDIE